jgi:hypothetical protein
VLEDVFQNVIGKVRLLATIKGENAKAYLLSCVVDREYFNKVTSNEVRTLLDQNRAKGPVKLTLLETYRIALKSFWSVLLVSDPETVSLRGSSTRKQRRFLFVQQQG